MNQVRMEGTKSIWQNSNGLRASPDSGLEIHPEFIVARSSHVRLVLARWAQQPNYATAEGEKQV
jgi:hypothetical protein